MTRTPPIPSSFDPYADTYTEVLNDYLKGSGEEAPYFAERKVQVLRDILRSLGAKATRLLDYGCGVGNGFPHVRHHLPDATYYGCDTSRESVAIAAGRWPEGRFSLIAGPLPYAEGAFDVILASVVFHHIPTAGHAAIIADLHRILRPGGHLFIFEHNPHNPLTRRVVRDCPFDRDAVLLPPAYARRLFASSPFNGCAICYYLFFPRALAWFRPLESALRWCPAGAQYVAYAARIT